MYGRKIFAVLILLSFQVVEAASPYWRMAFDQGGSRGASTVATANPAKAVNEQLTALNRKVHSRLPASTKVEMLRDTLTQIDEMRKVSPLQTVDKEIDMDLSLDSLRHVSDDADFNKSKCADYKARLLIDFEPTSENRPSNPALKRSFSIIEGLCS